MLDDCHIIRIHSFSQDTTLTLLIPCGDAVCICNGGYTAEHQKGKHRYTLLKCTWKMNWDILNEAVLSDHIYSPSQSTWVSLGQLNVPRMLSGTVHLGERAFLAVGGRNHPITVNKDY